MDAFGGQLGARGSAEVSLGHEELEPKVAVKMSSGGAAQARMVGDWMKRHGAKVISECLNGQDLAAAVLGSAADLFPQAEEQSAETSAVLSEAEVMEWAQSW